MAIELKVQPRAERGKGNEALREKGLVPGVFYGAKQEATAVAFSATDFKKVFKEAGETGVIELKGMDEDHEVLVHELSINPVTDEPIHVDFYAFEKGQELEVAVPVEFVGLSPLMKNGTGVLVKVLRELEIKAPPSKLPKSFEVNVEGLTAFDMTIHAKDLALPEGVTLITDPEEVVALMSEAKEEIIETEAATVDMAAIEVEKKGKDEEAPAEGEAAAS